MRKAVNISALVVFVWLVLDAFDVPNTLLYFLLVGAVPGTATTLSPTLMLSIMTGLIGIVVFEAAARRFEIMKRIRQFLITGLSRRQRLPLRRFTRI